ncbi:MAG: hypothetical protein ACRYGO_03665 [Janthinobacterium lividum]
MSVSGITQAAPPRRLRAVLLFLCAAFAILCLSKARLIGDGLEYLAMAQGFTAHASPELRRSDVAAFQAMPPKALARGRLEPAGLEAVVGRIARDGAIERGFARARDGSVQSIHFWMYSLLAAPFYALVTALGQNPFMGLVALNLVILGLAAWRLRAWLAPAGPPELGLLFLLGPVYYTVWSGPELMAGCCVLLATLALLRRDLALAVFLAGLGATQNPSIAGLILAAPCYAALYRLYPSAMPFAAPPPRRPGRAHAALAVAGVALAGLPYLHNQVQFGMPSIIGRYYNDPALVTPERLFSFLFDLNQGLVVGFPALLSTAAIVAWRLAPGERRRWLLHAAVACLLALGLALPTLSAMNWNSGSLVASRYAYWTAMPLLAVCLAGLVRLDLRSRVVTLGVAVLLQGASAWQAWAGGAPAYLVHGRLAAWVLDHVPGRYNPDPEIFLERAQRRDGAMAHDQVALHRGPRGPNKLMRYWSNSGDSGGLCAPGAWLAAGEVVTLASGWRYYNAPLRCAPGPAPGLRFGFGPGMTAPQLGAGWSGVEGAAVWTDGPRSTLRLALPPGRRAARLALEGRYIDGVEATRLSINGILLGRVALGPRPIALPAQLRDAQVLEIALEHAAPRPAPDAAEQRLLGFFLHGAYVEFGP